MWKFESAQRDVGVFKQIYLCNYYFLFNVLGLFQLLPFHPSIQLHGCYQTLTLASPPPPPPPPPLPRRPHLRSTGLLPPTSVSYWKAASSLSSEITQFLFDPDVYQLNTDVCRGTSDLQADCLVGDEVTSNLLFRQLYIQTTARHVAMRYIWSLEVKISRRKNSG